MPSDQQTVLSTRSPAMGAGKPPLAKPYHGASASKVPKSTVAQSGVSENCDPNLLSDESTKLVHRATNSKGHALHEIKGEVSNGCRVEEKHSSPQVPVFIRRHFCRSPRCAANNPDYALPASVPQRKFLISKRHLLEQAGSELPEHLGFLKTQIRSKRKGGVARNSYSACIFIEQNESTKEQSEAEEFFLQGVSCAEDDQVQDGGGIKENHCEHGLVSHVLDYRENETLNELHQSACNSIDQNARQEEQTQAEEAFSQAAECPVEDQPQTCGDVEENYREHDLLHSSYALDYKDEDNREKSVIDGNVVELSPFIVIEETCEKDFATDSDNLVTFNYECSTHGSVESDVQRSESDVKTKDVAEGLDYRCTGENGMEYELADYISLTVLCDHGSSDIDDNVGSCHPSEKMEVREHGCLKGEKIEIISMGLQEHIWAAPICANQQKTEEGTCEEHEPSKLIQNYAKVGNDLAQSNDVGKADDHTLPEKKFADKPSDSALPGNGLKRSPLKVSKKIQNLVEAFENMMRQESNSLQEMSKCSPPVFVREELGDNTSFSFTRSINKVRAWNDHGEGENARFSVYDGDADQIYMNSSQPQSINGQRHHSSDKKELNAVDSTLDRKDNVQSRHVSCLMEANNRSEQTDASTGYECEADGAGVSTCNSSMFQADSTNSSLDGAHQRKHKVTIVQPFALRTEKRGARKEYEFTKKLEKLFSEEKKQRIPVAQGLPWTTDEPEIPPKPPIKENTVPADFKLWTRDRAAERAEFDNYMSAKLHFLELQRQEEERLQQIAEQEEIKRMRREMVPHAQLMPYFDRPFIPKRSSKRLTIPKEPNFHVLHHKKVKCINSVG